jgi:hypothetical protein
MFGLKIGDEVEVLHFDFPTGKYITGINAGDVVVVESFSDGIGKIVYIRVEVETLIWCFVEGSVRLVEGSRLPNRRTWEYDKCRKM